MKHRRRYSASNLLLLLLGVTASVVAIYFMAHWVRSSNAIGFEAAPAPFTVSPRPADGETVDANPPCFVYPAIKNYKAYIIQVSKYPDFARSSTIQFTSSYMLAVSPQSLSPARYYWRWRPVGEGVSENEWSARRSFTVPAHVVEAPFPDLDALAKRIGAAHPRVQVTAEELPELRKRAMDKYGSGWMEEIRQFAVTMHEKSLLLEPSHLPDRSNPKYAELYYEAFRSARPFFQEMGRLAENYLLTGEELSGLEAKRRLLHVMEWNPHGSTSLSANDEIASEIVRHCPVVFDRIHGMLTVDERNQCIEQMMIRMAEVRALWREQPFEKYPYESHNMGYYVPDLLVACLALAGEAPVEEMLRYTMLQLWSPFYPPFGGKDGGWSEGPNYWGWSTEVFARTYRAVRHLTGIPVHLRSHLARAAEYKLYCNPPYLKMSPFGDGQENRAGGATAMAMLAALYENPYAKWYAEYQKVELKGLDGLVFDTDKIEAKSPEDLPPSRAFFDVGVAAMHTDLSDAKNNVSLLLKSSPFGSISHSYADQNTFFINAYGEPVVIPSGYYQMYGDQHHVEWTRQTKASTSVLVDGQGQAGRAWYAKGQMKAFHTTAAADYALGDAKEAYGYKLERFYREVILLRNLHTGGEPVILIHDELAAGKPSTFQFLLHSAERMDVHSKERQILLTHGQVQCQVDYLAPKDIVFQQSDRFSVAPSKQAPKQYHLTASTVEPARTTASLIAFQPYRKNGSSTPLSPTLEEGEKCQAVVMSFADRTLMTLFRTDATPGPVSCHEIVTDARVASISSIKGKIVSAVIFDGTTLVYSGKTLIQSKSPTSVSCSPGEGERQAASVDDQKAVTVSAVQPNSAADQTSSPSHIQ